jgi:hypothetical protein
LFSMHYEWNNKDHFHTNMRIDIHKHVRVPLFQDEGVTYIIEWSKVKNYKNIVDILTRHIMMTYVSDFQLEL